MFFVSVRKTCLGSGSCCRHMKNHRLFFRMSCANLPAVSDKCFRGAILKHTALSEKRIASPCIFQNTFPGENLRDHTKPSLLRLWYFTVNSNAISIMLSKRATRNFFCTLGHYLSSVYVVPVTDIMTSRPVVSSMMTAQIH